jgi:uncharacterized protein YfaT (DUF1175 family)
MSIPSAAQDVLDIYQLMYILIHIVSKFITVITLANLKPMHIFINGFVILQCLLLFSARKVAAHTVSISRNTHALITVHFNLLTELPARLHCLIQYCD